MTNQNQPISPNSEEFRDNRDQLPHGIAAARRALAHVEQAAELRPEDLAIVREALFALEDDGANGGSVGELTPHRYAQAGGEEMGCASESEGSVGAGQGTAAAGVDPASVLAALPADARPHWDRRRRVLTLGSAVVKRLRHPSLNQERVLAAFEELGWPEAIDDPLPNDSDTLPSLRLNDTVRQLNRHQQTPLIRFGMNGKANGVRWWIRKPR